jgi:2-polyprenyl-3-methyl-5-hydroxy-6-metoxy-1,4-benzoquinol methylase
MTDRASTVELYEDASAQIMAEGRLEAVLANNLRENIDRFSFVAESVKTIAPESVLDVGCSWGQIGSLLRLNHGSVKHLTGIDWSETCCKYAREHSGYDDTYCFDAEVRDESHTYQGKFDLVLCLEILEHVTFPGALSRNIHYWTKPGGHALFSCPMQEHPVDGDFHVRLIGGLELRDMVERVGFRAVKPSPRWLASKFCEPWWMGWNFVLGHKEKR